MPPSPISTSALPNPDATYASIVVGAGGAGLAAISKCPKPALWIDPHWGGGRLSRFPAVPSNTRISLFRQVLQMALASGIFAPAPGEVDLPAELDEQGGGCPLVHAAKMIKGLSQRVRKDANVHCHRGLVQSMTLRSDGTWLVHCAQVSRGQAGDNDHGTFQGEEEEEGAERGQANWHCSPILFCGERVILATGARPRTPPRTHPNLRIIDPECLLSHEHLHQLNIDEASRVAVIGSSHSAILIMRTLLVHTRCALIVNVFKEALRYAEYLPDGRIRYDNTGLKGEAASWARAHLPMEEGVRERLLRVRTGTSSAEAALARCDHIVWAIGYERLQLPSLERERKCEGGGETDQREPYRTFPLTPIIVSDYDKGQQLLDGEGRIIPNLYGLGIAFPERVIDVSGKPEQAVGLYKFMRTAERIFAPNSASPPSPPLSNNAN